MAIETAMFYLIALALPLWLVIEELALRQRQTREPRRAAAPSLTRAPATHVA